jgi:hypothetical protein
VEEDTSDEDAIPKDLPVLYPEVEDDEDDSENEDGLSEAEALEVISNVQEEIVKQEGLSEEESLEGTSDFEEELVVSEWPDPAKSGG